jgi:hypothetical protein
VSQQLRVSSQQMDCGEHSHMGERASCISGTEVYAGEADCPRLCATDERSQSWQGELPAVPWTDIRHLERRLGSQWIARSPEVWEPSQPWADKDFTSVHTGARVRMLRPQLSVD